MNSVARYDLMLQGLLPCATNLPAALIHVRAWMHCTWRVRSLKMILDVWAEAVNTLRLRSCFTKWAGAVNPWHELQ